MTKRYCARAWLGVCLTGAMLCGCASTEAVSSDVRTEADAGRIPKVTALYEKASKVHVHRFRKPLRDEQARLLRALATECDVMLAEMATWDTDAALTAATDAEREGVRSDVTKLETSLQSLRAAADSQSIGSMRTAHTDAVAAYERIRQHMDVASP
ncbi:MAG: hypothetical protein JXA69_14905 [Phycisphaerae bacterium]|nr:hypothetical protein [Phycisphaerae bacterium]